ncbi:hypothetical protein ACRRTK_011730 [Alexandromys fortis]
MVDQRTGILAQAARWHYHNLPSSQKSLCDLTNTLGETVAWFLVLVPKSIKSQRFTIKNETDQVSQE